MQVKRFFTEILGNTAQSGCADCEVRFFVRLHRKTADLLTQVKGFMCKLTE